MSSPNRFNGNTNKNARIKIDYRGIKPTVKFSYPDYKNQTSGSLFYIIFMLWFIINTPLVFYEGSMMNALIESSDSIIHDLTIILFLTIPTLIYYPFKKYWNNKYPVWQAALKNKYHKIFTKKDIIEQNGLIYCEIPMFSNIYFEYESTKDFSELLEYIEVKEHDFIKKQIRLKWDKKSKKWKKKIKIVKNEFLWYMRFYFKSRPTNGKIEVIFS